MWVCFAASDAPREHILSTFCPQTANGPTLRTAAGTDCGFRRRTLAHILAGASLLARHRAPSDPTRDIVTAATDGTLTEKKLGDLITQAATAQMVAGYAQDLRARSERLFTEQFHRALTGGAAADELLDSLRDRFNEAAEAITAARDLIPADTPAEAFLRSAKPAAIAAWQHLDGHIATISAISRVASQFGPRKGNFPQIEENALGDGFRLDDRAIWCCDGPNLEADSAIFRQPDRGHRTSPWRRLSSNTVAEAVEKYLVWAEAEWEKSHPNRVVQYQTADGGVGERTLRNPFVARL